MVVIQRTSSSVCPKRNLPAFNLPQSTNSTLSSFYLSKTRPLQKPPATMSGNSSVGTAAVHGAGDQRNPPAADKPENQTERYEEGKENSHQDNDSSKSPRPSHLTCPS